MCRENKWEKGSDQEKGKGSYENKTNKLIFIFKKTDLYTLKDKVHKT